VAMIQPFSGFTPKLARKILKKRKLKGHHCKQIGWWTDCKFEPPCVWLEDTMIRGYPWGYE